MKLPAQDGKVDESSKDRMQVPQKNPDLLVQVSDLGNYILK
jgi:hypothetical protein